jgi:hypothetical protein
MVFLNFRFTFVVVPFKGLISHCIRHGCFIVKIDKNRRNAGPWLRDVSIVSEQGGNGRQPALYLAFY